MIFCFYFLAGAIVGIPATINYKTTDDVQRDEILVSGQKVDWEGEAGQSLQNSIVLTEKAKRFMIAREIQYTNSNHLYGTATLLTGSCLVAYTTGFYVNRGFQLQRIMKRWARGIVFTAIAGAYGVLFKVLYDAQQCRRDRKADKKTAAMGVNYLEGGIEYYTKVLNRNMALRKLMGPEGEKLYTIYGNKVSTWSDPTVQLTARRDLMVKLYRDRLEKEKEAREKAKEAESEKSEQAKHVQS